MNHVALHAQTAVSSKLLFQNSRPRLLSATRSSPSSCDAPPQAHRQLHSGLLRCMDVRTQGYVKASVAEAAVADAVAIAVDEARTEGARAAHSAIDREVAAVVMAKDAEAAAQRAKTQAAHERAVADMLAAASATAAEAQAAHEQAMASALAAAAAALAAASEKAASEQRAAVEAAVSTTRVKERSRSNMVGIVKAVKHKAEQHAAVSAAVAAMAARAKLANTWTAAARESRFAEEAAEAAEAALKAQEAAVTQAVSATREEAALALEAALEAAAEEAAEEAAAQMAAAMAIAAANLEAAMEEAAAQKAAAMAVAAAELEATKAEAARALEEALACAEEEKRVAAAVAAERLSAVEATAAERLLAVEATAAAELEATKVAAMAEVAETKAAAEAAHVALEAEHVKAIEEHRWQAAVEQEAAVAKAVAIEQEVAALDKKAAVESAVAAIAMQAALSSKWMVGAKSALLQAQATEAAEQAARAQEVAVTQAVAAAREQLVHEQNLAIQAAARELAAGSASGGAGGAGSAGGAGGTGPTPVLVHMAFQSELRATISVLRKSLTEAEVHSFTALRRAATAEAATREARRAYEIAYQDSQRPQWPQCQARVRPLLAAKFQGPDHHQGASQENTASDATALPMEAAALPVRRSSAATSAGRPSSSHVELRMLRQATRPKSSGSLVHMHLHSDLQGVGDARERRVEAAYALGSQGQHASAHHGAFSPQAAYALGSPYLSATSAAARAAASAAAAQIKWPALPGSTSPNRELRAGEVLVPSVTEQGIMWHNLPRRTGTAGSRAGSRGPPPAA